MAETPVNPKDAPETGPPVAPAPGRFPLFAKLRVLLLVVVVVVLECLAAYLYLPSPSQTAAMAGATPAPAPAAAEAKQHKASSAKPGEEKEKEVADEMEVDLGEYCVTAFQSTSNTTLRIDFRLYGTVKGDNQKEFARLMEENKHRFREQVLVTVQSANVSDLTDAGLGLMKRKILERANRTLGKPLLQSVVVSDFSFVEQ